LEFNVGAYLTVGDVNNDGFGDVITGASIGNPDVRVYDGQAIANSTFNNNDPEASSLARFFAYDSLGVNIGVTVGATDFDGDGKADILTGPTQGAAKFRIVSGLSTGTQPPALLEGEALGLTGPLFVGG
jgi:hypothetical protein